MDKITDRIYIYYLNKDSEHIILERTMPRYKDNPQWFKNYIFKHAVSRIQTLQSRGLEAFFTIGKPIEGALF